MDRIDLENVEEAWVVGAPERADAPPPDAAPDPLWRRVPLMLVRFPGVLIAVILSSMVLALAGAATPLFIASAGSASVELSLADVRPHQAGLTVAAFGSTAGTAVASRDQLLTKRVEGIPELGARVLSELGSVSDIGPLPVGEDRAFVRGGILPSPNAKVRLATRTGFLDHIDVLEAVSEDGLFVPDTVAQPLGLEPGEAVAIHLRGNVVLGEVGGVYRSLAGEAGQAAPSLPPYWEPLAEFIRSPANHPPPPPLILAPQGMFHQLGFRLDDEARFQWEFPLADTDLSLGRAEELADELRSVQEDLDSPSTSLGSALPFATETTRFPEITADAVRATDGLRAPVAAVGMAGRLLALAVVAAAGVYAMLRRRVEVRALWTRGVGPIGFGSRAMAEAALPVALGSVAGWGLAVLLVRSAGPDGLFDASAARAAAIAALWGGVAALVLLGVASGAWVRSTHESQPSRLRGAASRIPWDLLVLALAGAAYYEIRTRGTAVAIASDGVPEVDALAILFPVLLIGGGAGALARLVRRSLPRLRGLGAGWPTAPFLALRRVAAASGAALGLAVATALALGVFLYAATLVSSTRATTEAKALVFTGAQVSATLPRNPSAVEGLSIPTTTVVRVPDVATVPRDVPAEILGIDPGSFPEAAHWDAAYGAASLEEAIAGLVPPLQGGSLPVVTAGVRPADDPTLVVGGARIDVRSLAHHDAFPGAGQDRTLIVADREALERVLRDAGTEIARVGHEEQVWARGDPDVALSELAGTGIPFERTVTVTQVAATPSFLVVSWTFGFLQALGLAAAAVAIAGAILYLQGRQRGRTIAYGIASRMGMGRRTHRLAIGLELALILTSGLAAGLALTWAASRLVVERLEVLPGIPPEPFLRFPLWAAATAFVAVAVASWLGAAVAQRAADRAPLSEVLRGGG